MRHATPEEAARDAAIHLSAINVRELAQQEAAVDRAAAFEHQNRITDARLDASLIGLQAEQAIRSISLINDADQFLILSALFEQCKKRPDFDKSWGYAIEDAMADLNSFERELAPDTCDDEKRRYYAGAV